MSENLDVKELEKIYFKLREASQNQEKIDMDPILDRLGEVLGISDGAQIRRAGADKV